MVPGADLTPPEGWEPFGTNLGSPGPLKFSTETDETGLPRWERRVTTPTSPEDAWDEACAALAWCLANGPVADALPYVLAHNPYRPGAPKPDTAADTVTAARTVMGRYSGWWDGSPEDSWRLERDLREALGMQPYEEEED